MEVKRKNKHISDCSAMRVVREGKWKTPWAYPKLTWANKYMNETPGRRGYIDWVLVRCNDTDCPAELWIKNEDFLRLLPNE